MKYKMVKKINSDINIVKYAVDDILLKFQGCLADNTFFNTKLILNELLINGVIHGNLQDKNKLLYIDVTLNNSSLIISVSDEGTGINYRHKNFGEYDFSDSGRGLMLVEGLSDKFLVDGNKVTCVQYLK